MGEHDALERIQSDHEQRIRNVENTLGILKSQVEQMVANTEDIKARITFITSGTATQEQLNRVENMAHSAHKRMDDFNKEFWKIQVEHANCLRVKDDTIDMIDEIKKTLTSLEINMNGVQSAVDNLQKDKDAVTTFFSGRLGTVVDRLIQYIPWLFAYLYIQYKFGPLLAAGHTITK